MKVVVTGSRGMLGRELVAALTAHASGVDVVEAHRGVVDLSDREATADFFADVSADAVIHAAARVGGIQDRLDHPEDFLVENLRLDDAVISAAVETGIGRLLYISSGGIYPSSSQQPIPETAVMSGALEGALEPYALAKIIGTRRCEYIRRQRGLDYTAIVPSNLYGPGEHFGATGAHLIAAAIMKVHRAKASGDAEVEVWGDGTALREFTFSRDLAEWLAHIALTATELPAMVNVGSSDEHSVRDFYEFAAEIVGYDGLLAFNADRPSGVARRLLDSAIARSKGWSPHTEIREGMRELYGAFLVEQGEE
ncbi:MAG: NAD-dependent epimerase/dehydratase family protein [Demequinaceae bacterium]|nr:NAD-dependent epimerase/dehydratase family protein [Demequinaceae bacterium]